MPAGIRSNKQISPQCNKHTLVGYTKREVGKRTPVFPKVKTSKTHLTDSARKIDHLKPKYNSVDITREFSSPKKEGKLATERTDLQEGKKSRLFKSPKLGHFIQKIEKDRHKIENQ